MPRNGNGSRLDHKRIYGQESLSAYPSTFSSAMDASLSQIIRDRYHMDTQPNKPKPIHMMSGQDENARHIVLTWMISAASGPTKWTPKTLPVFEWDIILAKALAPLRFDKLLFIGLQKTLEALIQFSYNPRIVNNYITVVTCLSEGMTFEAGRN